LTKYLVCCLTFFSRIVPKSAQIEPRNIYVLLLLVFAQGENEAKKDLGVDVWLSSRPSSSSESFAEASLTVLSSTVAGSTT